MTKGTSTIAIGLLVATALAAPSCSDAGPTATADAANTAEAASAGGGDTALLADGAHPCPVAPTVVGTTPIAINELQGKGDDWIELVNTGPDTLSLGGLKLADKADNGCPKMEDALTFPADATLAPGGRLLVVGKKNPKAGPQTDCLASSTTGCWHMAFKVSASTGDSVFLISAGKVVAAVTVPANVLTDTASWGRWPDGTGAYASVLPTPGAANKK
ncbi:MAG: lamin tail domain-containing protein [Deltaproteobacteria bacterium]|nr:lamin tail domain-containing protein [Deltaproteobacteria bacterium]